MSHEDQLDYIKDLQEKDKINKQMIQSLLEGSDGKSDLTALAEQAIGQLKRENDAYKDKYLHLLEQKTELIEIINTKNTDFENLQKEYEQKVNRLESSTCGSYGVANSKSLNKLFDLLGFKVSSVLNL